MIAQTTAAAIAAALLHALAGPFTASSTPVSATERVAGEPARVTGISLVPSDEGASLHIAVDDAARVRDFTLSNPNRIVVDLIGTRLGLDLSSYDGRARGAIRDVRLSQFAVDTVRVVVELSTKNRYELRRGAGTLTLVVHGRETEFARWDLGSRVGAPDMRLAAAAAPEPSVEPTAEPTARESAPVETPAAAAAPLAAQTQTLPDVIEPRVTATASAGSIAPPIEPPTSSARVEAEITRRVDAELARRAEAAAPATTSNSSFAANDVPPTVELPLAEAPSAAARRQPEQKPRITVSFDGTSIRDVIATFATFAGRTIVVGKDVEGTVTADIADKPWDVALQAILTSQGLAATEDASGIITVDSYRNLASNQALEPVVTQIVNVNYAKATTLVSTVRALLARDCTGLNTLATGRELGVGVGNAGGGRGGAGGQAQEGQGCVVRGQVAADSATNKLIITEVPSRLPEIVSRLQELDVRTPQVAIKAKIIFVNRTGIQDIGLAYDLGQGTKQFFQQLVPRIDPSTLVPVDTDGDGVPDARGGGTAFQGPARIALGGDAIAGIANANNAIKPNALNLIYSTALGRYQLTAFLNALQTSSLADVQSEPSVTILNNRTAEIFVGQEIPIRVIDASAGGVGGQGGGGGGGGGAGGAQQQPNAAAFFPRATVQLKEAGIRLSVTPQVTNNRMVLLNIKAENSNAEVGPSDVGVIFNQQRAESQVLVGDGEAAVIGGLTVTEVSRFRSGIPFLMNLPWVGRIFAQNTSNETKRDLLILVTPHILDDGASIPPGR